jgi:hypothetical protein
MILPDFETHQLIAELKDRGYTVLTNDEYTELDEEGQGGACLINIIDAMHDALTLDNWQLYTKLLTALFFAALGVDVEIDSHEEQVA